MWRIRSREIWASQMLVALATASEQATVRLVGGSDTYFADLGLFTMDSQASEPIPMWKPLTGEPCAGELHARFGGRGGPVVLLYPYQRQDGRAYVSPVGASLLAIIRMR